MSRMPCDYCFEYTTLHRFDDRLYEQRIVWLCPECHCMATDHEWQLIFDEIDDREIREPEASYR